MTTEQSTTWARWIEPRVFYSGGLVIMAAVIALMHNFDLAIFNMLGAIWIKMK